jgi:hypothetical protein
MAFNESIVPPKLIVRHKCQRKLCCNPEHLELGTSKQNALDRKRDGTQSYARAKITKEIAHKIRATKGTKSKAQRARDFKVSYKTVCDIDYGNTWLD